MENKFKKSVLVGAALLGVAACDEGSRCKMTKDMYDGLVAKRERLNDDQRYQQCIIERNHRSGAFSAYRFNRIEYRTPLGVIPTKESCLAEYNLETRQIVERREGALRNRDCTK